MQFQYTLTIIMSVIMSKPFIISMQVILPVLINKPLKGVQVTYIFVNDFKELYRKAQKELKSGRGINKLEIIKIKKKQKLGRFWVFSRNYD